MAFKICSKCGKKTVRTVLGMCLPCYQQEWYAKRKADGKLPAKFDPPPIMTIDELFECRRYRCRMQVRHCLEYQKVAVEQGDADYFRAGRLTVDRRPCLDCQQGKVIAALIGKKSAKADATPENPVAMKAERQNKAEDQRSDVGAYKDKGQGSIVQPGGGEAAILSNAEVDETIKTEAEEMTEMDAKNESATDEYLRRLVRDVHEPGAPVSTLMPVMCRQCGKMPAKNPVNGLCEVCLSELGKEGYAKRGQKHDWLKWGLRDHIELYEQIKTQGEREFRTPELQALWILSKAVTSMDGEE